jgi:excisionase family DNA binding protein
MATAEHTGELLTVQEVAERLRCSVPTVRRRIRSGELPAVQLGGPGAGLRVPADGLAAWLWSGPHTSEEN